MTTAASAGARALCDRVAEADAGVAQARRALEEQRSRARLAHTRARALERLRERAVARHGRAAARVQQRELDEIGALRARRRP